MQSSDQYSAYCAGDTIMLQLAVEPGANQDISRAVVFLVNADPTAYADPNRPTVITLQSPGRIVAIPPGLEQLPQTHFAGTVPGAIVGGIYVAAYAIFFVGDQMVTVTDIDPDGGYSANVVDDPSVNTGPPFARVIQ